MRSLDLIGLAFNGVLSRKLRSGLTSLGIIIGSAAFVSLVSLGNGVEGEIRAQLEDLGADEVRVIPGVTRPADGPPGSSAQDTTRSEPLSVRDEAAVERLQSVIEAHGTYQTGVDVELRGQSARLPALGIEVAAWQRIDEPELDRGRFLGQNERSSVMLGAGVVDLFDNPLDVNQQITINGHRFRVVGVLEDPGNGLPDENIYLPRETLWDLTEAEDEPLSGIVALKTSEIPDAVVAESMRDVLLRERGLNEADQDFTLTTAAELRERVNEITATITAFLGSIAAISLLVGGIGIANTMFMTVMERSKQIGILKAVGMTRSEVIQVFLFESSLLGFLGGLLGALLGSVGAYFLTPPNSDFDRGFSVVDPTIFLGMVGFAILIGSIAGLIPAFRAASVPPMESLQGQ